MSRIISRSRPILSSTQPRIHTIGLRYSSGHGGPVYVPPTGYLFNEKPPRKGKKRRREDWEPFMWAWWGITAFLAIGIATRPTITVEEWALSQARLRMEEDGINLDYKVD